MNERIKLLRKFLSLNQTEFGKIVGVKQGSIAAYENGTRIPLETVVLSICREFNVNEVWLRTGEGEMFIELPENDEVAEIVSDLLEEENPFYNLILDVMRTFKQLDTNSQKAICHASAQLKENLAKKKEG